MVQNQDIKRRLLREIVQDNTDTAATVLPSGATSSESPGVAALLHHAQATMPASRALVPLRQETVPTARSSVSMVVCHEADQELAVKSDIASTLVRPRSGAVKSRRQRRWRYQWLGRTWWYAWGLVLLFVHTLSPVTAPPAMTPLPAAEETFRAPLPIDLRVLPLGVKTIVLDPGHGGKDLGAKGPQGLTEKEVVLDIAHRLGRLLEEQSFHVVMTRKQDKALSLAQRATMANKARADLFVSIHVNWIEGGEIRGIETYHLGSTEDPALLAIAARENTHSGYSLADYRRLVEGIYLSVRRDESRRLAETLQWTLFRNLSKINRSLINRGVKTAPFAVLAATEMPAILTEVSCLSNVDEARVLATPEYRQYIAQALLQGIQTYVRSLNPYAQKES